MRFPEFTRDWKERKIKDLGNFIGGGTPDTTNQKFWEGKIPWVSSSDIAIDDIHNILKTRFITEEAIKSSATKLIPKGGIVMVSRVGIGKFAVADEELCTSQDFTNLVTTENEYFLCYYFNARSNKFVRLGQGTSIKGFTTQDIKSAKFFIPQLDEQQKISSFLSLLDEKITSSMKTIESLESLIKGVSQKLLTQKVRFKKFTDEWKDKRLGEICNFYKGSPLSKNNILEDGNSKCIHYGELFTTYKVVISEIISRTNKRGFKSEIGDILMPSSDVTPLGLATASAILEGNVILGGDINIIRPTIELNSVFLSYLLNFGKKKIIELVSGTTIKHIYSKDLKQIKISIPNIEEQTKIADFLSKISDKIETEKKILELLEQQKKYFLQNLFI